jgi:hypothetical protein
VPRIAPRRLPGLSAALALALPLAAACGSGGPAPGGALVPTLASAAWDRDVTVDVRIDLGGQDLPVRITGSGVLEADFEPREGGVRVSAGYRSWSARATNPMAGTQTADESQIQGRTVFDLDARGRPTVVSVPTTTGAAAELFDGTQLAHEFVPRMPGRVPGAGESWTDTITYTSSIPGGESRSEQVVRYTAVGDTVVDGRTLLHIRAESEDRAEVRGSAEGQAFRQNFSGTSRHTYLWDGRDGVVHYSRVEGEMSGSMTMVGMGMEFPMRAGGTTEMRRRGEG